MAKSCRPFLAFVALAAAFSSGCGRAGDSAPAGRKGGRSLPVRTAPVVARDVVYTVKALGSLEPDEMVQITAEVAGVAREVLFNAGDKVTTETVLVRIDRERYRLEAEKANAAYRRAVADFKRAEADFVRREALAKENLVAVEELGRARQETEKLAADAAAAKAAADIAAQNGERSAVRAPRAGEINTRTVDTGQFVQAGNVLATLLDPRKLRLRFKISESESMKAKEGEKVTFRVASLGDREFPARVYHVSDVADPSTRQVEVLAWVDNPGVLKPGFFAEVVLATATHAGALVVVESAVQASERGFVVYAVEGGKARVRPVTLGLRTGDGTVEILSGLKVGETVIIEGSDRLSDGMGVEEAPEAKGAKAAGEAKAGK
jgi:multidrug efflux system membrane fusion protein